MKKQVYAYMNHGRWLVKCPEHGEGRMQVDPRTPKPYIPPCCHPGIVARIPVVNDSGVAFRVDRNRQKIARIEAEGCNHVYEVVFPENWQHIEARLSGQPKGLQNWLPGVPAEEL